MFDKESLLAQLLILNDDTAAIEAAWSESEVSLQTRTRTRQLFELASNVMDQAFFFVWSKVIGETLEAKDRARTATQVVLPVGKDLHALESALGKMKALDLYHQNGEFRALLDRFQPRANEGELTFQIVREVARLKHTGLPKMDRNVQPYLFIRGVTQMVVRQIRLQHRDVSSGREYRLFVDGNSFNPVSGKYDLPLQEGAVGIQNLASYLFKAGGPEVCGLLRSVQRKLREALPAFEHLAEG